MEKLIHKIYHFQEESKQQMWCFVRFGSIRSLKNVKNTHRGVLLLVKLQASVCNLLKVTLLHGCFPRFLNCPHGAKSRNTPQMFFRLRFVDP